ncbi:MAG: J domain-containing protein [Rhizobiales bacterium]|nr:J domain-containing protein [Hyphomicrobiales bacterium]
MQPTAFPLTWPATMPRTKTPVKSQFRTSLNGALNNVRDSLLSFSRDSDKKIDGLVISSNVTLGEQKPADPGVAVWFTWDGLSVCIAVDRYPKVEDNLQAIHHVIEARRTELRHGGLHIVRATFTGFAALPSPGGKKSWREVLLFGPDMLRPNRDMVEKRYRELAKERHPDAGGSAEAMSELNAAKAEALREIGNV